MKEESTINITSREILVNLRDVDSRRDKRLRSQTKHYYSCVESEKKELKRKRIPKSENRRVRRSYNYSVHHKTPTDTFFITGGNGSKNTRLRV